MARTDGDVVPNPEEIYKREVRLEDVERLIRGTAPCCKSSAEELRQELSKLKVRFCWRLATDKEPTPKQAAQLFADLDGAFRRLAPLLSSLESNQHYQHLLVFAADQGSLPGEDPREVWHGLRSTLTSIRSLYGLIRKAETALPVVSSRPDAITWLLGYGIPRLYERHFDDEYGDAVGKGGKPNSPGSRFSVGVLKTFGLGSYSVRRIQLARQAIRDRWGNLGEGEI